MVARWWPDTRQNKPDYSGVTVVASTHLTETKVDKMALARLR